MIDLRNMTPQQIERFCVNELGQRSGQGFRVAAWTFRERAATIDALTDINRPFRESLRSRCVISALPVESSERADDGTTKLLYRLDDDNRIEGVLIPNAERLTLCVSSQVGCASGCGFCMTGSGGFTRNLTTAEIVNQVFAASSYADGREISNIVLMGTGEPLSNYEAVTAFVEIATDRYGMGFAPKRITVSTCGLAPQIERLADDGVPASLAVSLNATTDEVRDRIMPVNRAYPIARLMQAVRNYCERTGRTVTIEYVLFRGVNDSIEDAKRLVSLTEGLPCMVNLLTFNEFPGSAFRRPEATQLSVFRDILVRSSIIAVVRKSRGGNIQAACGQLRANAASGRS